MKAIRKEDSVNGRAISRATAAAGAAIAIAVATWGLAKASDSPASAESGATQSVTATGTDAGVSEAAGTEASPTPDAVVPGSCSAALAAPGSGKTVAGASAAATEPVKPVRAKTAPEASPGEVEPKPAAKTVAPKKVVSTMPRRAKPMPMPDAARRVWWPAKTAGKLNLTYAGQASFSAAIALLFDGDFETPESANQNIQVKDSKGRAVHGRWVVASNRQMLLFKAVPGLYSIEVGSGLADKGGRGISAPSAGLVFVQ